MCCQSPKIYWLSAPLKKKKNSLLTVQEFLLPLSFPSWLLLCLKSVSSFCDEESNNLAFFPPIYLLVFLLKRSYYICWEIRLIKGSSFKLHQFNNVT